MNFQNMGKTKTAWHSNKGLRGNTAIKSLAAANSAQRASSLKMNGYYLWISLIRIFTRSLTYDKENFNEKA